MLYIIIKQQFLTMIMCNHFVFVFALVYTARFDDHCAELPGCVPLRQVECQGNQDVAGQDWY